MKSVGLNELAAGRLPDHAISDIERIELTTPEVVAWEESKPRFQFVINERAITIEVRFKASTKRSLAIATGVISLLWAGLNLLVKYLPVLLSSFNTRSPSP